MRINEATALIDINYFYSKNVAGSLLFSSRDYEFERLFKRYISRFCDSNIKNLILDLRGNPGGYLGNVYYVADYFLEHPVDEHIVYRVSKYSKEQGLALLKNQYKLYLPFIEQSLKISRDSVERLVSRSVELFKSSPDGLYFSLDTLMPLKYIPKAHRNNFSGKVYVLTDNLSFSASISLCCLLENSPNVVFVGEPAGGYTNMSGGPTITMRLPYTTFIPLHVPYTMYSGTSRYTRIDISIEPTVNEWLTNNRDVVMEQLIEKISNDKYNEKQ